MSQSFLRPSKVGAALGVSTKTVSEWIRRGKIGSITTPSGRHMVPASEVKRIVGIHMQGVS